MKVSFCEKYDINGYHYNQCISMTQKHFDVLKDCFLTEYIMKNNKDLHFLTYINAPITVEKDLYFINHTQRDYIANKFYNELSRKLLNRNTYIRIIKE
jgi:hypothetical protein